MWLISGRWILDLGWLLFLLILLTHFWRDRKTLIQAQSWLMAKGRITRCELTQAGHSIWPKIEYSYQVYDKDLVGEHLLLDTSHNSPNSKHARHVAYKAAVAFRDEEDVEVYYNPNHPEQSALDITMPGKLTFILILISTLIMVHVGMIIFRLLSYY